MKIVLLLEGKFYCAFRNPVALGKIENALLKNPKIQQSENELREEVNKLHAQNKVFLEKAAAEKDENIKQQYKEEFDKNIKLLSLIKGPRINKNDVKQVKIRIKNRTTDEKIIDLIKYDGIIYEVDIVNMPKNFKN